MPGIVSRNCVMGRFKKRFVIECNGKKNSVALA